MNYIILLKYIFICNYVKPNIYTEFNFCLDSIFKNNSDYFVRIEENLYLGFFYLHGSGVSDIPGTYFLLNYF